MEFEKIVAEKEPQFQSASLLVTYPSIMLYGPEMLVPVHHQTTIKI
jgi:hypothetical protein